MPSRPLHTMIIMTLGSLRNMKTRPRIARGCGGQGDEELCHEVIVLEVLLLNEVGAGKASYETGDHIAQE